MEQDKKQVPWIYRVQSKPLPNGKCTAEIRLKPGRGDDLPGGRLRRWRLAMLSAFLAVVPGLATAGSLGIFVRILPRCSLNWSQKQGVATCNSGEEVSATVSGGSKPDVSLAVPEAIQEAQRRSSAGEEVHLTIDL